LGARDKLLDLQLQWAQHCEEKGEYDEARVHYVNGNMAKEAVDMYILPLKSLSLKYFQLLTLFRRFLRAHNLPKAIETAERYAPEELQRVLLMHAEHLFETKDFGNFEAIVIRAEKPEIAIELYKVRHNNIFY
jgi:hypothetical protein